jgi:2-(1,2-epoxy-1,2-dihydrophenyl)acetyl-CoA isomerase
MTETVLLERRNRVAVVTLNRPGNANTLDLAMGRALLQVALLCEADAGIGAVVLTGAGKHFCFGGDLRGMVDSGASVSGYLNELTTHLHAAITSFTRLRAPVIAAVNGTAAGAGVGLVCMADLALGGRSTKFSLAYTGVGLAPDGSTSFLLPRIVGRHRAMELFLTNRALGAEEAQQWGLLNQVVDDEQLQAEAFALAERLAAGPTDSFGAVKRLLAASDPGLESQLALEGRTIAAQGVHAEGREGIAAFLEKRKPDYHGGSR